jgi:anti-sigma28 factor (negative regulator of flagellin synthesis)
MDDERALSLGFTVGLQAAAAAIAREPERIESAHLLSDQADREARIAELRRQCQSGEYRVDASALGAKIVDDHLA